MSEKIEFKRTRPMIEGYGIAEGEKGMLTWDFVQERMAKTRNIWLATTNPNGHPHVVAVWCVWVDDTLYFGGGPATRWSKNLARSPQVCAHLESTSEAVIVHGKVEKLDSDYPDKDLLKRIDAAYMAKYSMEHGTPFWRLVPEKVLAWTETDFANSPTRFVFKDGKSS